MTIEVQSLRKEFNVPGGTEIAVADVSFTIHEEEFLTLVGPSGCGKTTTLRCIAGLETPTSGDILIEGKNVVDIPANKRDLAMMFQNIALYPHMTIRKNIAYPLKVRGIPREERNATAREAAKVMQIEELLDKHPGDLSGGQRQRAALARTTVQDPKGFLMDEPLSDLDAKLKVEVRKEIQEVHKRVRKPTLYVTHDQEEAMTMSDRIAVMRDGQIAQIGTPDDLYSRPENVFVSQFIGNPTINHLRGSVRDMAAGNIELDIEGKHLDFEVNLVGDEPETEAILVGFRPQNVRVSESTTAEDFQGKIRLVERINDRILANIDGPQGEIRAQIPVDHELTEGTDISFSFERDRAHVFDYETEEAFARGVGIDVKSMVKA